MLFVLLKYQSAVDKDKWKNSRFYHLISGSAGKVKCHLNQSIILHDVYCLPASVLIIQQSRCQAYTIISPTAWEEKQHNLLCCIVKLCPLLAPLILHVPCVDSWQFGCWKRQTAQVERGAWANSANTQGGRPSSYGGCLSMTAGINTPPTLKALQRRQGYSNSCDMQTAPCDYEMNEDYLRVWWKKGWKYPMVALSALPAEIL